MYFCSSLKVIVHPLYIMLTIHLVGWLTLKNNKIRNLFCDEVKFTRYNNHKPKRSKELLNISNTEEQ